MQTYRFTAKVFCPFSGLEHLPATGGNDGHLLVLDDEARVLKFLNARNGMGVAANVSLDDKTLPAAKEWIDKQLAAKTLAQVVDQPPATVQQAPAPASAPSAPAAKQPNTPGGGSGASATVIAGPPPTPQIK